MTPCVARLAMCVVVAGLAATAASLSASDPTPLAPGSSSGRPIDFIENRGQWGKDTLFVARGPSVSARFERGGCDRSPGYNNSPALFVSVPTVG
jgi:hypothetical protein